MMPAKGLKIIFMGSPDFACPSLKRLAELHEILHVFTQPPRASGRGMSLRKTAVAELAESYDFPVSWPTSLKDDEVQAMMRALKADLFVVVAYGLLLPKAVLDIPRLGCVNGHASLLPRWRGAAPIQRAIEAGDSQTASCAMMMEEGLDTGPVILCHKTDITDDDTASSLHDRLAEITADCLAEAVTMLADGTAKPQAQSNEGICYAAKITKKEAEIDFSRPAAHLKQHIHAFSPFPGAFIEGASGQRLKCLLASLSDKKTTDDYGSYLGQDETGGLMVACGDGKVLTIDLVQPAGKKPMRAADYLRGRSLHKHQSVKEQI